MKLLNLDDLGGTVRPVMLNGVQYNVKEQTIQQLIESVKSRKALDQDDTLSMFESLVDSAMAVIPDAPEKEIRNLNVSQLKALIQFSQASDEEIEAVADGSEKGKGKGKGK